MLLSQPTAFVNHYVCTIEMLFCLCGCGFHLEILFSQGEPINFRFKGLFLFSLIQKIAMALSSKSFKYSVVLNIFSVDAPGTIMPRPGDMFIKVCLLGQHQKTKLVPAIFPLMFDQRLIFEKVK